MLLFTAIDFLFSIVKADGSLSTRPVVDGRLGFFPVWDHYEQYCCEHFCGVLANMYTPFYWRYTQARRLTSPDGPKFFFLMEVWVVYNVVLVFGVQHSDSVTQVYVCSFPLWCITVY